MAENNKTYRIRTTVGREADSFLEVKLDQDYDSLEILSLKISDKDTYKLHNSDYGVVVGRVLANGNFGVPNAKISVFIEADENNSDLHMWELYPYTSTTTKNSKDIRYNLLPDESVKDCHKAVGTFPNKTYLLENDSILEVFDKYYVYTTRTNAAGDYLICGVPTGMQTLHMDLDLSDCGILSQRPRDFVYKGYTIEQFDNPNQFKKDENIDGLSQIFSQNQPVYVKPFWGNKDNGDEIGITRADIEISFKFEPTCVFMGSAISDNASNGVGKKCVPTNQMGYMEELTAGEGTIEMIRKTPGGHVEEFSIRGNQLINGNGVWCYQIPMNLDYMMTDEYGNMVPTDDPEKGIPTRARVRFRASLTDMDGSSQSYYRAKYLIPNNPGVDDQKVDYNFGTYTEEDSYRDLFWNGVYTIKSYIPRFQKSKRWRSERFTGIKACNYYGSNNPMPYNSMRIRLPFMFTVLCIFVKLFIKIVTLVNRIIAGVLRIFVGVFELVLSPIKLIGQGLKFLGIGKKLVDWVNDVINWAINSFVKKYGIHCTYIGDGLCPDMEGWYFAPGCGSGMKAKNEPIKNALLRNTLAAATDSGESLEDADNDAKESLAATEFIDETSTDSQNISAAEKESACVTVDVDYLMNCFEMNLAQEYRVIKFDFCNDWVNGVLYFPRWMRKVKRKKKYKFSLKNGITTYYKDKVQGCMNSENSRVKKSRYYTQQCSLAYKQEPNIPWTEITTSKSCYETGSIMGAIAGAVNAMTGVDVIPSKCHKKPGMDQSAIFGKKSGLVTEETTMLGQFVYYLKPCEWKDTSNGKVRTLLFATDIILLGTLNDCDENGIPQAFKYLNNSSYIMPTNLALTTMDDDAYIYTNPSGTVCSSGAKTNDIQGSVRRVTPDYQSTYCAYTKTDGDQVEYGESDDPIPVTESAGITWNYSGPGQDDVESGLLEEPGKLLQRLFGGGNKRYKYLYYPGGHFLSLSCVNSDSNIKSCVNLKRICELGATMSQRREEVRGYDDNGNPTFRYYVPTGLISNVDIESAAFRSMFATLNHNKLIATERNEATGYKKYNFRFLRPDGFDGGLAKYVHEAGSPYNKKVNENDGDNFLTDASELFRNISMGLWEQPLDYDKYETKYTERRTVEDSIDDYYMFRFGLNTFDNNEQKKHYLLYKGGKYSLPQYENSFYFYFGLRDGSTALDEFKKQFFSECQSNNIAKTPSLTVREKIDKDTLEGSASVIIDNMLAPYSYTLKDNTQAANSGSQAGDDKIGPYTTENDVINFVKNESPTSTFSGFTIGHEYTVTVTDSLDNTISKTFVFGASAVKVDMQMIHFRIQEPTGTTNDPRMGGYVKINDNVLILKQLLKISDNAVGFAYKAADDNNWTTFSNDHSYTDEGNETWYMYYLPKPGLYEIALRYNGNTVSIFTVTMEDNRKINVFVSCDYLAYKPEFSPTDGTYKPCCNNDIGLRGYDENLWYNGARNDGLPFHQPSNEGWLMRHSYYRQTPNDNFAYDNYVYTKGKYEVAIFGQPESGNSIMTAGLNGTAYDKEHNAQDKPNNYSNDYDQFVGYAVDDTYTFIPTMYYDWTTREEKSGIFRNAFDAMSYSDDGRAAADVLNAEITDYKYYSASTKIELTFSDSSGKLVPGHGCLVVLENGVTLFPIIDPQDTSKMVAYGADAYPNRALLSQSHFKSLLGMASIYPTLRVPSMYKPFYGIVSAAVWSVQDLTVSSDDDGEAIVEKYELPLSYKVEGDVYNGLTIGDMFDLGQENNSYGTTYGTYLIFKDKKDFYDGLTIKTNGGLVPELQTTSDFSFNRKIEFGRQETTTGKEAYMLWPTNYDDPDVVQTDNEFFAFGRQIVTPREAVHTGTDIEYVNIKDITSIEYAIRESMELDMDDNVYTERYEGKQIDQVVLKDSCSIAAEFYNDLNLKAYNTYSGMNGLCSIYTDEALPSSRTQLFATPVQMFDIGDGPMTINEEGTIYYHGSYNENIKYDPKGGDATVVKDGSNYRFSVTQENGSKVKKRVSIGNSYTPNGLSPASRNKRTEGEDELYASGITLSHKYTLKKEYRRDIKSIGSIVDGATQLAVSTPGFKGSAFTGTQYSTLIARYIKPDDRTKNKLTVYQLYPIGALHMIYPANEGGVEAYFNVASSVTYTKIEQTVTIAVSTNVKFKVEIAEGDGWITTSKTNYDATETNIDFHLAANTGSGTGGTKYGKLKITVTEEGVSIPGYPAGSPDNVFFVDVIQTPDDVAGLQEQIDGLQDEIDNLTPSSGVTGG